MAGVPIKFRCYQCNRLLGVSPSKVGSIVSCPKCRAELVVPSPAEQAAASDDVTSATGPFDPPPGTRDGGPSFDLIDLRPEDIRVEPGADRVPYTPPPEEPSDLRPESEMPFLAIDTSPPPPLPSTVPPPPPPPRLLSRPEPAPALPLALLTADDEIRDDAVIPPIEIDAPRSARPRSPVPQVRARDIVLPRSAVATWSLFVLLAQGLAFLAGLLAGHFLWRVH